MTRAALAAGALAAAAAFVAVAVATDEDPPASGTRAAAAATATAATREATVHPGRLVFVRMGCGGCHAFAPAGSTGEIGPDLTGRLTETPPAAVRALITERPPDGVMPADFGTRMTRAELDDLVAFLRSG